MGPCASYFWPNLICVRGLPLITYASRGGEGVNSDAYKCVQGGRGGLSMTKNTHFVRRCIENATVSKTFKDRVMEGNIKWLIEKLSLHGYTPLDLIVHISSYVF